MGFSELLFEVEFFRTYIRLAQGCRITPFTRNKQILRPGGTFKGRSGRTWTFYGSIRQAKPGSPGKRKLFRGSTGPGQPVVPVRRGGGEIFKLETKLFQLFMSGLRGSRQPEGNQTPPAAVHSQLTNQADIFNQSGLPADPFSPANRTEPEGPEQRSREPGRTRRICSR